MHNKGKLELELASGEMARNTAAFLFALDREKRTDVIMVVSARHLLAIRANLRIAQERGKEKAMEEPA